MARLLATFWLCGCTSAGYSVDARELHYAQLGSKNAPVDEYVEAIRRDGARVRIYAPHIESVELRDFDFETPGGLRNLSGMVHVEKREFRGNLNAIGGSTLGGGPGLGLLCLGPLDGGGDTCAVVAGIPILVGVIALLGAAQQPVDLPSQRGGKTSL